MNFNDVMFNDVLIVNIISKIMRKFRKLIAFFELASKNAI